jgi:lactate dehydrogenase-like 2-hydroxyacid dehydrogenase
MKMKLNENCFGCILTHAEYAIALLLATSRRIPEGLEAATNGEWSTWKIMWMCGPSKVT